MYENEYKNPINTNLNDLNNFLQLVADLDEEIELFAIGGTAMVIKNIKESTKDIDFLTTMDYTKLRNLLRLAGLREKSPSELCNIWYLNDKIRIDIFYNEMIFGVPLSDDWRELSEHIRNIGKVKLYVLNWFDIIITKLARSQERDIQDIIDIIKAESIDVNLLEKRYYEIASTSLITEHETRFEHLKDKIKQLK